MIAVETSILLRNSRIIAVFFCALLLLFANDLRANDWRHKSYKVVGDGILQFDFPKSWGKKPAYEIIDTVTDIRLGPFGPKSKPYFLFHVQAFVATDPIGADALLEITKIDVETFRKTAFETDIPISDFEGPHVTGHYFSITDKSRKRGEFDYLTMAVSRSRQLLVKVYFLSSDGAPDFGADAMQMLRSIKYTPPPPEPEEESEEK